MDLTCPECSYVALRRVKGSRWECGTCGTSFDFRKLRNALDSLVGRQFWGDFIDELLGDPETKDASEIGERGLKFIGKYGTLYALDIGNDWFLVLKGKKRTSRPRSRIKA